MFDYSKSSTYDREPDTEEFYGIPPLDATNLVTVTHFLHIDHTPNGSAGGVDGANTINKLLYGTGVNTQRADRLTHNPVHNLKLKSIGYLRQLLGLPNMYVNITPDSLIRVPNSTANFPANCDPQVQGFREGFIPQHMDAWIRGHKSTVGVGADISNFGSPLVSFLGDDSAKTMGTFGFVDKRADNYYTEMNHHAMSGTADSPDLYVAMHGLLLQTMGLNPTDPAVLQYLGLVKSFLPPIRKVESEATFSTTVLGATVVIAANIGVGTPLTPITFPENYAIRASSGDVTGLGWRWMPNNPNADESHYIRTEYYMDINLKKVYDEQVALINLFKTKSPAVNAAIPDTDAYVSNLFSDFGLDKARVPPVYIDLTTTWIDTGFSSIAKPPTIPRGKSVIVGKENSFIGPSKIIMVQPLVRNHCKKAVILATDGYKENVLYVCKPNNSFSFLATHDTVYSYGMYGPNTTFIDMHNHVGGKGQGHLPTDGLNSEVYAPGSFGPIIHNGNVLMRAVTYSNNPHDQFIDAAGIFIVYTINVPR